MLTYNLDERADIPKYQYLYIKIKEDIQSRRIPPGSRLPSKRTLAEHLGISSVTVESAYNILCDEGYVASRQRSGYFVLDTDNMLMPQASANPAAIISAPPKPENVSDSPFSILSRLTRRVISEYGERLYAKPPHNGCEALRSAISDYLLRFRGISVDPRQVVIGSGSEYLYMMIVQLLGREKIYAAEDPSYEKIRLTYEANGAKCLLLPMDAFGIDSKALKKCPAKVLHVTPFHSFPSGITANAAKRIEYLEWAKRASGIIIEDDYDSEFNLGHRPAETLFSMDKESRVIYLNTFTRTLAPSIRIGYMILPESLVSLYNSKLGFYSCAVPVIDQYVLAKYISGGYFERHLNRMRKLLREKADPAK